MGALFHTNVRAIDRKKALVTPDGRLTIFIIEVQHGWPQGYRLRGEEDSAQVRRDTPFAMDAARLRMSQYDEFIRRCSRARIVTRTPSLACALRRLALELRALNRIMGHILADRGHPTLLGLVRLKETGLVVLRKARS
jgi:hypothetical protein